MIFDNDDIRGKVASENELVITSILASTLPAPSTPHFHLGRQLLGFYQWPIFRLCTHDDHVRTVIGMPIPILRLMP